MPIVDEERLDRFQLFHAGGFTGMRPKRSCRRRLQQAGKLECKRWSLTVGAWFLRRNAATDPIEIYDCLNMTEALGSLQKRRQRVHPKASGLRARNLGSQYCIRRRLDSLGQGGI